MKLRMVPMSEGSIASRMVSFALPIFLGNLFQQLYNTADSLVVGIFWEVMCWQQSVPPER